MTTDRKQIWRLLFAAFALAAYFLGLGALPFLGPDEPRYAQVAGEMLERGDWITPTLGGANWFEKPALLYWLEIVGYKIFGVSEFSARFGSAIFGLLTISTVYLLCRFYNAETRRRGAETKGKEQRTNDDLADWAFVISASSIGLLAFSHAASFDIILTFPVTAALACFFASEIENGKSKTSNFKFQFGFYFFIGVALLAKGLIGIVLPFGVIFCYFVLSLRFPDRKFVRSLFWGVLLSVGTAAIWYLPVTSRHGWQFVNEFFVQHHFARYTSNKYAHPEPFYFFWWVLPILTLPWLPFLFTAIWNLFKVQNPESRIRSLPDLRVFALAWLLFPLVFFTFSGSKLPGYILPALPAALILIAGEVCRFVEDRPQRRFFLQILAGFVLLAVPVSLNTFAINFARRDTTKFLLEAANRQGFGAAKILNLHDVSHSLEFYAAKRLVRLPDGKQWKFEGTNEVLNYLKLSGDAAVLVLVPVEHEHQLFENPRITASRITENGAFALDAVSIR